MADELIYEGTADTVLAVIANLMLFALYALSPMPTFWRILIKQSTEKFHPYPYMIALLHCYALLMYAFPFDVEPMPFRSYCLYLSNHIGLWFLVAYFFIFYTYTTGTNKVIMCSFLPICIGVFATVGYFWYSWIKTNGDTISTFMMVQHKLVVPICVVSGVILYASPLSVLKNVYKTKSVEFLPFWLCMACFMNGLVWVIYAWVSPAFDPYIAMANGVGLLLGAFQLRVFYKFYVNTQNPNSIHLEGLEVLKDHIGKTISNYWVLSPYTSFGFVGKLFHMLWKRYLVVFAVILGIFVNSWLQEKSEDIYSVALRPT